MKNKSCQIKFGYSYCLDLDEKSIPAAMENHRLLILNQTAASIQWGTALRHLILLNEPNDSKEIVSENATISPGTNQDCEPTTDTASDPNFFNVNAVSQDLGSCDLSPSRDKKPGTSRFGQIQHL